MTQTALAVDAIVSALLRAAPPDAKQYLKDGWTRSLVRATAMQAIAEAKRDSAAFRPKTPTSRGCSPT